MHHRGAAVFLAGMTLAAGSFCGAAAQTASLREQLPGTWTVVSQYNVTKEGKRQEPYGSQPIGTLVFDRGGNFSYTLFDPDRPKFASRDKYNGTPAEYKAAVDGGQAYFGTYTVDEANSRITYHIKGSLEPSWQGTDRNAAHATVTGNELKHDATTPATGTTAHQVWRKVN
jgi:hypothetical protein